MVNANNVDILNVGWYIGWCWHWGHSICFNNEAYVVHLHSEQGE